MTWDLLAANEVLEQGLESPTDRVNIECRLRIASTILTQDLSQISALRQLARICDESVLVDRL